ncbi:neurexin-4-like [Asterias rubens]|uniref:neurexin-4-like n=1 Tax=Asterias rubens TaxID=7604 RepID=UPI0014557094|nr:neurexin-4-like [Asterias rubens]
MGYQIPLVLAWIFTISVKFCTADIDANCRLPLGMESGAILDGQISATSWIHVLEGPRYARLHNRDGGGGWTAGTSDLEQYLTIDLGSVAEVTGVATQGRYNTDNYVQEYRVMLSTNGKDWTTYSDDQVNDKMFEGNTDGNLAKKNEFTRNIEARYVRFNPTLFIGAPAMRVEVYGCLKDTASFDGNTYIKYDVSNPDNHIQSYDGLFQARIRTTQPDGVLLAGVSKQSDYLFIQMKGGKILVSINLGDSPNMPDSGMTELEGGSLLDDNQWHLIEYKRQRQTVELIVDGVAVATRTNGLFSRLDLDKMVTIGGAPMQHKGLVVRQYFRGCMQHALLSNSVLPSSLGTALNFIMSTTDKTMTTISVEGNLVYSCSGDTTVPATFPTKSSYLKWRGPNSIQNYTISLKFRTFGADGLFISNPQESVSGGYINVGLIDGTPFVVMKTGSNPATSLPGEGSDLNDGKWHSIRLEMTNNIFKWTVDGETGIIQRDFSLRTGEDYFIGGASDSSQTGDMPGFRGCMKDVYLGNTKVDFMSVLTGTMPSGAINEGVDIDTCSLVDWCSPNPCANGGTCETDWDTFTCKCIGTGYTGTTCSVSQHGSFCQYEGTMSIDPDGSGPIPPVMVDCEKQDDEIFTLIHHDSEDRGDVPPGSVAPGSYSKDIAYEASLDQINAIIHMAEYCEQHIKYECNRAKLLNSPNGDPYGWWVSHNNQKMAYWGGAAPGTGKCECGLFETCYDQKKWCNCDADNAPNKVDEGLLRHKEFLPVKQLRFGDVDNSGASAKYTLGPLKCRGNAYTLNTVTFRTREAHLLFPVASLDAKAMVVSLEFKTTQDSAVLAAADGRDETFVKLEMNTPKMIRFTLDYGAGLKEVDYNLSAAVNDDQWHHVMVTLDTKEVTLAIDGGATETVQYNMGKLRLRLTSDFFIGSSTLQSEGFLGCMRSLIVNGRFIDMVAASKTTQQVVAGCSGKCDDKPCLNVGKCIETYDEITCQCEMTAFEGQYCSKEIGSLMEGQSEVVYDVPDVDVQDSEMDDITLAFTTDATRGRLLRVESSSNGVYQELALQNPQGFVTYTYKLGAGDPEILTSEHNFADGRHHYVTVKRNGNEAILKVDDYVPISKTTSGVDTTFQAVKLYIGGQESSQSFKGCISRVKFNDIYPLKRYYSNSPPDYVTSAGSMQKSRCRVEEEIPNAAVPEIPVPPTQAPVTGDPNPLPPAKRALAPGDQAAIAFVIIVLLIALIVLVVLVVRHLHQHKGMYRTNEAKGSDDAGDADTAVMMTGAKQLKPDKKKEWYI